MSTPKKKTYTDAQRAAALADLEHMPAAKVMKRHGIRSMSVLYHWRDRARAARPSTTSDPEQMVETKSNGNGHAKPQAFIETAIDHMDENARRNGVRSLTRQDLYTLLARLEHIGPT